MAEAGESTDAEAAGCERRLQLWNEGGCCLGLSVASRLPYSLGSMTGVGLEGAGGFVDGQAGGGSAGGSAG